MDPLQLGDLIASELPYEPNGQQIELIAHLARFCLAEPGPDRAFLINGYAGTGKTSLTAALVRALGRMGRHCVMMAPTGRAAKVFASFSGLPAYTIHRQIYRQTLSGQVLAENRCANTLFIVDEASMIGDADGEGRNLLADLIEYVYAGANCRMLLLGDTAQLPPVGCFESPAMNAERLRSFGLKVARAVVTKTVRQASDSGILYNATWLRKALAQAELPTPQLTVQPFPDVKVIQGEDLADEMNAAYARDGMDQTVMITRSNRRAKDFNIAIRGQILERDNLISRDENLLVAKNNYHWAKDVPGLSFIANGDVAYIEAVYGTERRYGFEFADVDLTFPDRGGVTLQAKIILDTLLSDSASLSTDQINELARATLADPEFAPASSSPSAQIQALKASPYYNALQVKYSYAVTCHKAQGGQWRNVFIDMGYIAPDMLGVDFYRWLYTAVTRATTRLYLLNPTIPIL
ncbi:MAG: AAA family ATPase [Bacteroidales bacterium]|nr:AAA family ATPase [Bacteroidales bacterium]